MKIILQLQSHDPSQIQDLRYDPSNNIIQYFYNGKMHIYPVEDSLTSYILVKEKDDTSSIEIVNSEVIGI